MRTIALIGVPWNPGQLVDAANDAIGLGARLCVVDTDEALRRVPAAADCDRLPVPGVELDPLSLALRGVDPAAVFSLSEPRLAVTAQLRERLGMPGTGVRAEQTAVDKLRCRQELSGAGLTEVRFTQTSLPELKATLRDWKLPVVVKPRALAGSNGVRLIEGEEDVEDLLREFLPGAAAFENDALIVESYIPGEEISAEAVVVGGRLVLLTLTDKINSGPPYFQECGHIVPSQHDELRGQVAEYLQKVVTALRLVTAPLHVELKIVEGRPEIVEINVRFGGGNIVQLMERALGVRAFRVFFAALLSGETLPVPPAKAVWGVGFFTARVGSPLSWSSYDFPHPEAVSVIDLTLDRRAALQQFEGVRIRYWRPGYALFHASDHSAVRANIEFMAAQLPP